VTSRALTAAGYLVLAGCLVAAALVGRQRPDVLPRVADVVRHVARTRAGQLVLLLVWWWLGWHFVLAA